jgi:hypothetical protein
MKLSRKVRVHRMFVVPLQMFRGWLLPPSTLSLTTLQMFIAPLQMFGGWLLPPSTLSLTTLPTFFACDSPRQSQGMASKPGDTSAESPQGRSLRPQAQRVSHRGKAKAWPRSQGHKRSESMRAEPKATSAAHKSSRQGQGSPHIPLCAEFLCSFSPSFHPFWSTQ